MYSKRAKPFTRPRGSSLSAGGMALEVTPFPTVYGRGLLRELRDIAPPKYLIVTMRDLWEMDTIRKNFPKDEDKSFATYFVESLEASSLRKDLEGLQQAMGEQFRCIIGLGGGQAVDVAKFFSWSLGGNNNLLFLVPTALTVDAPWGHRAAVRYEGVVRYVGFATPSAVYVDYDVIRSAPLHLNLSGVGDVLCFHTAHYDWKLADEDGQAGNWPYDEDMVNMARKKLEELIENLEDVKEMTDRGIRILASAFQFGGAAYHSFGWNPRPVEGFEHLFFYALEYQTRKHFIHGYPVMLGTFLGSLLQGNRPEFVLDVVKRCGIDIRPEEMGTSWAKVKETLLNLDSFVKEKGYMYTIASKGLISLEFIEKARAMLYDSYN